jgi:alanine racemase
MEIDLEHLAQNVAEVRRVIGSDRRLIAVAKADAYGHGVVETAPTMQRAGADVIALGSVNDAVRLREAGFQGPILLFGSYLAADVAETVVNYELVPTVWDLEGASAYAKAARSNPQEVYLKVDTGFHRIGVLPAQAADTAAAIASLPHLQIGCIYTHFSDPVDGGAWNQEQYDRFVSALETIRAAGVNAPYACVASSAVVSTQPSMYLNAVDPGRLIYGFHYPKDNPLQLDLLPVARAVKSRIVQTKWIKAGEPVGYGRTFQASRRTQVGVLPFGWSDGLYRRIASRASVLVKEKRCPVIGTLNLEHCLIDLTDVDEAGTGDEVVVIGRQGDAAIEIAEHAAWAGVSEMEVIVQLGRTLPRAYFQDDRLVHLGR